MTNPIATSIPSNGYFGLKIQFPTKKKNQTNKQISWKKLHIPGLRQEIHKMSQENLAVPDCKETTKDNCIKNSEII